MMIVVFHFQGIKYGCCHTGLIQTDIGITFSSNAGNVFVLLHIMLSFSNVTMHP